MIEIRPHAGLGRADHGWLNATHHFSFSNYHAPDRMGWGAIRVWNDDTIAPESGFPPHSHSDMEIITFVRSGAITHQDSLGNTGRTNAGDVQVMSAGTGITHSEYNLENEQTSLFQIWITPDRVGAPPSWGKREFPRGDRTGHWEILASGESEKDASLPIRCDARVLAATLSAGQSITYETDPRRHLYLVASTGRIRVNGHEAQQRDGVAIIQESVITLEALDDSEVVMVDAR